MKIGIKTGLKNYQDLDEVQPDFCELWFHSGKIDEYDELFAAIKRKGCQHGLHFWGALEDGTLANLAYPDKEVLNSSIELVKKTIDVAAKEGSWYVNVHPGGAQLARIDFVKDSLEPYGAVATFEECQKTATSSLQILLDYAKSKDVLLLLESVPPVSTDSIKHRRPVYTGELPFAYVEGILTTLPQLQFTNDFGHTASNLISDDRTQISAYLFDKTKKYAPRTRLIHTGFLIPPYNGTDYHGNLYEDIFKTAAAIPNESELVALLNLFRDRTDVGVIVEPSGSHPRNFEILKTLIHRS